MLTVVHQKMFTSYWFTLILGAFFTMFSFMSVLFIFHASSDTLMVKVHSSDIVVHEAIVFQLMDNSTLQFLVLSSLREAIKSFHM